jgi:hypothetical protein
MLGPRGREVNRAKEGQRQNAIRTALQFFETIRHANTVSRLAVILSGTTACSVAVNNYP